MSEAPRADPVRSRFLEVLSRRIPDQPEAVRAFLQARLQAASAGAVATVPAGEGAAVPRRPIAVKPNPATSPLAQLNQSIRAAREACRSEDGSDADELASARRFHRTWTSLRIEDQVDAAVARKPANAGPLNSHVLVLQSLDLMRELSPQYLERFLAHVETLQWLEDAAHKAAEPPKPTRRKKKP